MNIEQGILNIEVDACFFFIILLEVEIYLRYKIHRSLFPARLSHSGGNIPCSIFNIPNLDKRLSTFRMTETQTIKRLTTFPTLAQAFPPKNATS
jgi:hypothetical protein